MVNGILKFEVATNTQRLPSGKKGRLLPPAEDDPWINAPVSTKHIAHILQCQHAFLLLIHVWCDAVLPHPLLILALH